MAFKVAEWRRLRGMSQKDLGDKVGVHANTIRYWEQHPEAITVVNATVLADALDIKMDDIIFLP